jgi:hypothetical protein
MSESLKSKIEEADRLIREADQRIKRLESSPLQRIKQALGFKKQ